ncbi:hypothetical protein DIM_22870 [Candidatus Denitrolinea symbiosum]|nr:hypothetical protein DIM_22870 [Candidatus Denitrolinea symbiosum]
MHPKDLTLQVIGTCVWVGVDNVWEQEKLEARTMLLNRAESHTSGAPRKSGGSFFTPETVCLYAKYTLKRQNDKPYKAVEVCRRGVPEVHRGCRSN